MDYRNIITVEPGKRGGKPSIRGLRFMVYDILAHLASAMTEDEILADSRLRQTVRASWGPHRHWREAASRRDPRTAQALEDR